MLQDMAEANQLIKKKKEAHLQVSLFLQTFLNPSRLSGQVSFYFFGPSFIHFRLAGRARENVGSRAVLDLGE